jgi:hypothetical protein
LGATSPGVRLPCCTAHSLVASALIAGGISLSLGQ